MEVNGVSEVEIEDKPNHGSKTYWGEHGKYQKESDILQKLVPYGGQSQDTRIELYRRTANTYYDIYNNGGGNLAPDVNWGKPEEYDDGISYGIRYMRAIGIELPITMKLIDEFGKYSDREGYEDEHIGDTDKYFEDACVEIDEAMDKVIEHIKTFEGKEGFPPLFGETK